MINRIILILSRRRIIITPSALEHYNEELNRGIISKEEYDSLLIKEDNMNRKEILKNHKPAIKQLNNGRYYTRIEGKTVQSLFKKKVEEAIITYYAEQIPTMSSIFEGFMDCVKAEKTDGTLYRYRLLYDMYVQGSTIEDKPLVDLRVSDAKIFLEHCLKVNPEMKYKYWINIKALLNRMFQYAIEMEYTSFNPFKSFNPSSKRFTAPTYHQEQDTVFSPEEKEIICDLASKDSDEQKDAIPLAVKLLFLTGIRDGELCGLKWCDIENIKTGKCLHIQRMQVVAYKDGKANGYDVVEYVKTKNSNRRLPLSSKALELLKEVQRLNKANGIGIGSNDFIFQRKYKGRYTYITTRSITPRLARYCREAGMDEIKSPHDIRRTYITELYQKGMPLKKIQVLAGHSDLKMTLKYIKETELNEEDQKILDSL